MWGETRTMKTLASALLVLLFGCAGTPSAAEPVTEPPAIVSTWLAKTPAAQIVDVRTKEEFADGHLPDATLIPWTDPDFTARASKELDPEKPVLVYCRSGRRSTAAATALAKLGFTEIRNLEGGILAWQEAGKPVTKPK